jgi:hypothetical protein
MFLPGLFCQEGQGSGIVADEVLAIGVVEQKLGKGPGRLARLHASRCLADQGCPSLVLTPRHNVLRLPCGLTADAIVFSGKAEHFRAPAFRAVRLLSDKGIARPCLNV